MNLRHTLFDFPQFDDEETTRAARLMHIVLLTYLVSAVTFIVVLPLVIPHLAGRLAFPLALFPIFALLFQLNRRGRVKMAAFILLSANWLMLVLMSISASGVNDPSYASQILLIFFAGFLFGRGAAIGLTVIDLLLGLWLILAEDAGHITPIEYPAMAMWYSIGTLFVGAAILVFFISRSLEEALRQARLELAQRQKAEALRLTEETRRIELESRQELTEAKEQFISMVSHEFKNPLAVISTSTDILDRYSDRLDAEKRQEHLAKIRAQCAHMNEMLNEILAMRQAAQQVARADEVNLGTFFRATIEQFRLSSQNSHPIRLQIDDAVGTVRLDVKRLQHVLDNVVSNAIKYSPAGRMIDVRVEKHASQIQIQVRDRGIGIPPEAQPHIFAPFHRADNVGDLDGTGLGLSIVKEHVESMQGTITFESLPGQGTTFTIVLPELYGAPAHNAAAT